MPTELARRVAQGERDAVALALNLVDDQRPDARVRAHALLDALEREHGSAGAHRIGVTGAPGAGKSTLLDALVRALRRRDRTVGVIAVDPSSQRSGGALLGDRIRVRAGTRDPGVYFRSMAARSRLGGLSDVARAGVLILGAAYDTVLVETVGVGQSEADVAHVVDTLCFVAQPGAGDLLQFMKAGVLELPDVFAVNKADLGPVAERTRSELDAGLGLSDRTEAPPVVLVSARDGTGVEALLDALVAHGERQRAAGALAQGRLLGRDHFTLESLRDRYGRFGLDALGGEDAVRGRLAADPAASGAELSATLAAEIEEALRKG